MGKVSAGGAAGIGIGCAIAGALICSLVFWLIGYQRRRHGGSIGSDEHTEEFVTGKSEKRRSGRVDDRREVPDALNTARFSVSSSSMTTTIGTIEAADQEVREDHHALMIAIKGHAELYYTTKPISEDERIQFFEANMDTLNDLLGPDCLLDAFAMDVLLQASETRHDAIRLLVAWVIFRYIQPDAEIEHTLLPPELVNCAQAMSRSAQIAQAAEEARRRSSHSVVLKPLPLASNPYTPPTAAGASSSSAGPRPQSTATTNPYPSSLHHPSNDSTTRLTFAKWRSTSGTLLSPLFGSHGAVSSPSDPRIPNINDLVTTLVCLLQPYVAKGYGGARVRDLENVVKQGAAFGWRLFVQRTEWEFAWSTLMGDEVAVFPALVKVGDAKGKRLRQSIVLAWEETVKIDEGMLEESKNRSAGSGFNMDVAGKTIVEE